MRVREYTENDLVALRAIHAAQGFDYTLPDLRNPLFLTKLVLTQDSSSGIPAQRNSGCRGAACCARPLEDNDGQLDARVGLGSQDKIIGAALLRLTAEAYLLLDPNAGTPRERWQLLLALHAAAERDAWQRGLEDVHAWLPPRIAKTFGRRLERLGWLRDDSWTPYCKRLSSVK